MRALLYRYFRKRPQVVDAYLALEDGAYCLNEDGSNFIVE
jgi:hypothetical protein